MAILSKNSLEYAVFYFGASAAGVVPVPLNYRLAPAEWAYIVNDAGARMLIASEEFAEGVDSVRDELGSVESFRQVGGDPRAGWESYGEWVGGQSSAPCGRHVPDDADAYQMYTSGTTGHPKGAVIQQRAVTSNVVQAVTGGLRFSPGERALIVAPMYHAAAGIVGFSAASQGASLYIQEDFVPPEVVRAMDEEGIASALLVPAMIQACLVMVPDLGERAFANLRSVVYGASPIAAGHAAGGDGGVQVRFPAGVRDDGGDGDHHDDVGGGAPAGDFGSAGVVAVGGAAGAGDGDEDRRRGGSGAAGG